MKDVTTDVVDTGGKLAIGANDAGNKTCHQCRWVNRECEYLRDFSKKIKGVPVEL
jgi:hypothetical protein